MRPSAFLLAAIASSAFTVTAALAAQGDPVTSAAASPATVATPVTPGISDLEKRVTELEKRSVGGQPALLAKADSPPAGFRVASNDGKYELRIRPVIQADGYFYFRDKKAPAANQLLMRRVWLPMDGKLPGNVAFRLQPDFGMGKFTLLDAYVEVMPWAEFGVRAGKFKSPVGLERLASATELMFAEAGYVTSLVPNRDIGAQVQGRIGGGKLVYAAGVVNGVLDGASSDGDYHDDKDLVARLFSEPFAGSDGKWVKGLGLGAGGSVGDQAGSYYAKTTFAPVSNLPSYKSPGGTTFFKYLSSATSYRKNVVADGTTRRLAPQGYYYAGPIGFMGEYGFSEQRVKLAGRGYAMQQRAWTATVGYVLTGEDATLKGVVPRKPLGEGCGAWQLVARVDTLRIDPQAFPLLADVKTNARAALSFGAGLNWYATANLRALVNYEKTQFERPAATSTKIPDEYFATARVQVKF